jgi:hypothetical protein
MTAFITTYRQRRADFAPSMDAIRTDAPPLPHRPTEGGARS